MPRATPPLVVLSLCLAGCASWPRLTKPPLPPPAGAEFLSAVDGTRLYSSIEGPGPRGVVWLVMGPEIASTPPVPALTAALHEAGFATAVFHARGTGFSDGLRGDVDDYSKFVDDYRFFLARLLGRFPRVFLFGQSAGGAFALELAAHAPSPLAGVVLVNPAWRVQPAKGMGPSFGDYLVYAANFLFRPAALTVDMNSRPDAVEFAPDREEALALQRDPLVVRYFSMRTLFAQKALMDRCPENIAAVDAPVLMVGGAHDALIDPASLDELLAKARTTDKQKLVSPEGGHGSSAVETRVGALVDWLVERAPAAP
ncbi:MAG: alpha/beta fold hydrolase [Myxococcota bacterium]